MTIAKQPYGRPRNPSGMNAGRPSGVSKNRPSKRVGHGGAAAPTTGKRSGGLKKPGAWRKKRMAKKRLAAKPGRGNPPVSRPGRSKTGSIAKLGSAVSKAATSKAPRGRESSIKSVMSKTKAGMTGKKAAGPTMTNALLGRMKNARGNIGPGNRPLR